MLNKFLFEFYTASRVTNYTTFRPVKSRVVFKWLGKFSLENGGNSDGQNAV